jgi:succinate-acetate transporter protein
MNDDARVFLRPIGSPIGLGLAGLTAGSLISSGLELGWIAGSQGVYVGIALLTFSFPLQAAASLLAFLARDGVVGTAMGILSGTWLSEGLIHLAQPPGGTSGALGLLQIAAAVLVAGCAASAAASKLVPASIFGVVSIRFVLAAIYNLTGTEGWQNAAGAVGVVVSALAAYAVWAAVLEDARGRTVLPLGRRGVTPAAGEPGIRPQL